MQSSHPALSKSMPFFSLGMIGVAVPSGQSHVKRGWLLISRERFLLSLRLHSFFIQLGWSITKSNLGSAGEFLDPG